jgi:hypothetical protein
MTMKRASFAALLLLAIFAMPGAAQDWGYGPGWGYGYVPAYGLDRLPYFSLYPPVYYSRVVPRAYGYSPFAYPPGYPTPEPGHAAPQQSAQPLRVINPYVTDAADIAPAKAGVVVVKPKVIYPAAMEDGRPQQAAK